MITLKRGCCIKRVEESDLGVGFPLRLGDCVRIPYLPKLFSVGPYMRYLKWMVVAK